MIDEASIDFDWLTREAKRTPRHELKRILLRRGLRDAHVALRVSETFAEVACRWNSFENRVPFNTFQAYHYGMNNVLAWVRFYNFTEREDVAGNLYLRALVARRKTLPFPSSLCGEWALTTFERWLSVENRKTGRPSDALELIGDGTPIDPVEWFSHHVEQGREYLRELSLKAADIDPELVVYIEQGALPAAFLCCDTLMMKLYCNETLPESTLKRMDKAFVYMGEPGVVAALMARGIL